MTNDLKGKFVVCVTKVRSKVRDGKLYENYDLVYLIKPPEQKSV